jgi:acetyl esterase/lipase
MNLIIRGALGIGALVGTALGARSILARRRLMDPVLPELRNPALLLPLHIGPAGLRLARALASIPGPVAAEIAVEQREVPGGPDHPSVDVLLYDNPTRPRPSGALLWLHGGGMVLGHPGMDNELCSRIADRADVVVVSVDYRLAPEHPFPGALEDCYRVLRWLHEHAEELGVDPARIAIGGNSAGAGLAAALAQVALDRGEVPVRFQLLVYPMLDDRTVLRVDHAGTGDFVWSPRSNEFGWTSYLGHRPGEQEPPPYAAPARRADLAGLPPAWIGVGDLDLFHAEDRAYAERLRAAGVPCQLDVVAGMYHAADVIFSGRSAAMDTFRAGMVEALTTALHPS